MHHFAGCGQFIPLCLNFTVRLFFFCNSRAVKHYCPRVSSSECSPPGTEASGWLVCLAVGLSPATTSTWPEFSSVEGCNSPKVASQTIVYTTAHYCQVKGKRPRQWINMERSCLQQLWFLVIFLTNAINHFLFFVFIILKNADNYILIEQVAM